MDEMRTWWKAYEKETVFNRAVPNVMDGMKPIHRKIFYTALYKFGKTSKSINTNAFSGAVKEYSNYHHGDTSLVGTINNLTADYKNNLPMFISEANFGNRLKQDPAAARYTDIKLNKAYSNLLIMPEILNFVEQDDKETHDPDFYFFSIPTVLINGISGIAVGVKTDILSYDPKDIKENVKRVLQNKKQITMTPKYPQFKGKIKSVDGRWIQCGIVKKVDSTHLEITEIPTNFDRDKYISHLQKLKEIGKIISYVDHSSDGFKFVVKVNRKFWEHYGELPYNLFKLKSVLSQSIIVLSPEGDRTIKFETPEALINFFVSKMIKYVEKYINFKINEYTNKIDKLAFKVKFIQYVLGIDIRKYTYKELLSDVIELRIPENYTKEFMNISILGLTKDSIQKYEKQAKELNRVLGEFKETTSTKLYLKLIG